jgi:hypothetical protein
MAFDLLAKGLSGRKTGSQLFSCPVIAHFLRVVAHFATQKLAFEREALTSQFDHPKPTRPHRHRLSDQIVARFLSPFYVEPRCIGVREECCGENDICMGADWTA